MLSHTVLVTALLESLNILVIFTLLTNFAKIKLYLHNLAYGIMKSKYNSKEVTWTFFKDTKIMAVCLQIISIKVHGF